MQRTLLKTTTSLAVATLLAGCFVSETPLLTAENARATPMKTGVWEVCPFSSGEPDGSCEDHLLTETLAGSYILIDREGGRTGLRLKRLARYIWIGQMNEGGDEASFYVLVEQTKSDAFALTLMNCGDLPEAILKNFKKANLIEHASDSPGGVDICEVQSVKALKKIARVFVNGEAPKTAQLYFDRQSSAAALPPAPPDPVVE